MKSAAVQTAWALVLLVTFLIVIPAGFVLIILDTSIREAWAWCLR